MRVGSFRTEQFVVVVVVALKSTRVSSRLVDPWKKKTFQQSHIDSMPLITTTGTGTNLSI